MWVKTWEENVWGERVLTSATFRRLGKYVASQVSTADGPISLCRYAFHSRPGSKWRGLALVTCISRQFGPMTDRSRVWNTCSETWDGFGLKKKLKMWGVTGWSIFYSSYLSPLFGLKREKSLISRASEWVEYIQFYTFEAWQDAGLVRSKYTYIFP